MSATEREFPFQNLQESWEHFRAEMLSGANEDQQTAMHNAFFAGATSSCLLFVRALETSNKRESKALAQALFNELSDFMINDVIGEMVRTEGNA